MGAALRFPTGPIVAELAKEPPVRDDTLRKRILRLLNLLAQLETPPEIRPGTSDDDLELAFEQLGVILALLVGVSARRFEERVRVHARDQHRVVRASRKRAIAGAKRHLGFVEDEIDARSASNALAKGGHVIPWAEVERRLGS